MIRVQVFNAHPKYRVRPGEIRKIARGVLEGEGRADVDINIVFIGTRRMVVLNGKYLNHRYTTDVLSFSLTGATADTMEGEVYINLDEARRQAHDYDETIKAGVARLVVHGILHLAGHLDGTKSQKARMTRMENKYLTEMNITRSGA